MCWDLAQTTGNQLVKLMKYPVVQDSAMMAVNFKSMIGVILSCALTRVLFCFSHQNIAVTFDA